MTDSRIQAPSDYWIGVHSGLLKLAMGGTAVGTGVNAPANFGAGPINLEVTNAANRSVSLAVQNTSGHAIASLQSINPDTPGVVKLDIAPGDYLVVANQPSIKPAELHVGSERSSPSNSLLQP